MGKVQNFFKKTAVVLSITSLFFFSAAFCYERALPDTFLVSRGQNFCLNDSVVTSTQVDKKESEEYSVSLKLFGVIPIKTASVSVVDRPTLTVLGTPFGVKLLTKGVMVISTSDVQTNGKTCSPATDCGIKVGDVILCVEGEKVISNSHIASIINKSGGKQLSVKILRNDTEIQITLTPQKSDIDGEYKAGIWVRDSSAGIGTATFYDKNTKMLAGLGHGICDSDTGEIMPLSSGEIVDVTILGLNRGASGKPGEIIGTFASHIGFGELVKNSQTGVYGKLTRTCKGQDYLLGLKQEIKTGKAYIFSTLENDKCEKYEIEIEKVNLSNNNPTKNMIIRVTDKRLLEKTGGIIQGMSGSPIIQDDKLIGAVTHVFVNDPTKGYAIFAENMYETMLSVS